MTTPPDPAAPVFPSRFASAGDSPGFLLWRVSNRWQRAIRQALEPTGLTHSQFVLLTVTAHALSESPTIAGISQAELSLRSGTDKMTVSQIVPTLVRLGLLARSPDPTDARAFLLAPTPVGQAKVREALPIVEAADIAFFSTLGGRRDEITALLRTLSGVE